ncbi:MAG: lipid A biosynthesis acyltransferase [Alphaproteobacteria bacterium]|nr:lipid A biosynthesis acyltransferase [Alphaproteobacteria bacterium]
MKRLRYYAEAALVFILMHIFKALPLDAASATGGFIGRTLGPRLAVSRKALRNIARALPDMPPAEQQITLLHMWDNLGRTFSELPHLKTICATRVELINGHIADDLRNDNKGAILFGAHLANWEIPLIYVIENLNLEFGAVYREPNNPYVARVMEKIRNPDQRLRGIAKSRTGARDIIRALKENIHLGIFIDQKYNEGIAAPFFGHPAMTSPAFAELGQKFVVPVVPLQIERLNGANFRVTLHDPLKLYDDAGAPLPALDCIANAHRLLEDWIRARPAQWLWLHRRWPDDKKAGE